MVKYGLCYRNKKQETKLWKMLLQIIKVMRNYTESEEQEWKKNIKKN